MDIQEKFEQKTAELQDLYIEQIKENPTLPQSQVTASFLITYLAKVDVEQQETTKVLVSVIDNDLDRFAKAIQALFRLGLFLLFALICVVVWVVYR